MTVWSHEREQRFDDFNLLFTYEKQTWLGRTEQKRLKLHEIDTRFLSMVTMTMGIFLQEIRFLLPQRVVEIVISNLVTLTNLRPCRNTKKSREICSWKANLQSTAITHWRNSMRSLTLSLPKRHSDVDASPVQFCNPSPERGGRRGPHTTVFNIYLLRR